MEAKLERLCSLSVSERQPLAPLHTWPDVADADHWFFSPELLSLEGMAEYDELDEAARKRLSFHEAVNFFSLNIHGERFLVEGIAARLYRPGNEEISPYLHHFLEEENNHMTWFGGFCQRYAGRVYPDKKLAGLTPTRDYAPGEEDFLFFARAMLFEQIVDSYNRTMARDPRLDALAREVNARHHAEEKRHLAFGRGLVAELHGRHAPGWSARVQQRVVDELAAFLDSTWSEYANAEVYADAGLAEPFRLRRRVLESDAFRDRRARIEEPCLRFLAQLSTESHDLRRTLS